jgi:hypothetical protein
MFWWASLKFQIKGSKSKLRISQKDLINQEVELARGIVVSKIITRNNLICGKSIFEIIPSSNPFFIKKMNF